MKILGTSFVVLAYIYSGLLALAIIGSIVWELGYGGGFGKLWATWNPFNLANWIVLFFLLVPIGILVKIGNFLQDKSKA